MKKFKIIEEGRILTHQALAQVHGGSNICVDPSWFRMCSDGNKTVCNGVTIGECVNYIATCDGRLKICTEDGKIVCGGNKSIIIVQPSITLN